MDKLYEWLFYGTLLLTGYGSYRLWKWRARGRRIWVQIGGWAARLLVGLVFLFLMLLQTLRWFAPRGSWVYEIAHITEHYYKIWALSTPDLEWETLRYGDHKRHYMMVCRAKNQPNPPGKNIVFYVHGGGWNVGFPELHRYVAQTFARAGYWVVMPAYRLGPRHGYPEMIADMRAAFQKTWEWKNERPELRDRGLVIGGTSAGGNLAALLLYDPETWAGKDSAQLASVRGFFSISGALDMQLMPDFGAVRNFTGPRDSEQFRRANPMSYLPSQPHIPVLCLHGTQDGLVPYPAAESFLEALKKQGTEVELHRIENGTHLSVAAKWYYSRTEYHGQEEILTEWLHKLEK